jgi:F-type H+-transporting ATPase subunit b
MMKTIRTALVVAMAGLPAMALAAEQQSGGMPQLAFGNPWTIAQVVWMLIIFGLLYYVMAKYALPQVESVLEARRQRIEGDLESAQASKQRADAAMAEYQAATARARAESNAAINAAAAQAAEEAQARSDALSARLAAQIDAAEQRITASRDAAMAGLRQVATETAEALIGRLVGAAADPAMVSRAVARELALRGQG